MKKQNWFDVDKDGLRKLVADRAPSFVLWELISNAWDEPSVTEVKVKLTRDPNSPFINICVEDDAPEGFSNLSNAWTLFADVRKRKDPTTRGRFCLGDKLILAMSKTATIITTSGGVRFDEDGRHTLRTTSLKGSSINILVRMSVAEEEQAIDTLRRMAIPPADIHTVVNGIELAVRNEIREFNVSLPTVLADDEGVLRRVERRTQVSLLSPANVKGWLYEMGVPVVETGDQYDYNIQQKVPLNQERDGVPESYLRTLRVHVLNATYELLKTKDDANAPWVRDACSHSSASSEAVKHVMALRFGANAVSYDPSDREANLKAASRGMTVVAGASLSSGEWDNVRKSGVVIPAGRVCPTAKMYADEGEMAETILEKDWTDAEWALVKLTLAMAAHAGIRKPDIEFVKAGKGFGVPIACNLGKGQAIHYNVDRLGRNWAVQHRLEEVVELVIHELAHHKGETHYDDAYRHELELLGARSVMLALRNPELFKLPEE